MGERAKCFLRRQGGCILAGMNDVSVQADHVEPVPAGPDATQAMHRFTQALVILAALLSAIVTWWVAGKMGLPTKPRYAASLLQETGVWAKVLGLLGAVLLC